MLKFKHNKNLQLKNIYAKILAVIYYYLYLMHKIFEIPVVIESKNYVNDLFIPINDNLFFHKFEHSLEVAYRAVEL